MRERLSSEESEGLAEKLVAHRGFHGPPENHHERPLENTRLAYQLAAELGVAYAECDVWATSDGVILLSHDAYFGGMAADPLDPRAVTPIMEQTWHDLHDLELSDGSFPVRLTTVLDDLVGTRTKLAVELKSSTAAAPLAKFLVSAPPEVVAAVGFVLSFSLYSLEQFWWHGGDVEVVWIVDNPSVPYTPDVKNEGETTFDPAAENLTTFLRRIGEAERVGRLTCGLYMQYAPTLELSQLQDVRADLAAVHSAHSSKASSDVFVGVWSDRSLDPGFDRYAELRKWLPTLSVVNTDLPDTFWDAPMSVPILAC